MIIAGTCLQYHTIAADRSSVIIYKKQKLIPDRFQ
jgi:hypothetical protein